MTDLKPCPFCGGDAWLYDYEAKYGDLPPKSRAPQCKSCGASLGYLTTPAKAIAAWNRRPRKPIPQRKDPWPKGQKLQSRPRSSNGVINDVR